VTESFTRLKVMIFVVLLLVIIILSGCGADTKMTPEKFFKGYVNLDPVPSGISDFSGTSEDRLPVFLNRGFYKYNAEPSFFEDLVQHEKFFDISETNQKIHKVQCSDLPHDFSLWTKEVVNTQGKECYMGVFFPYVHYIIYDPSTKQVNHFYEGTRG